MSDTSTRSGNESAYDLFDRWLALRQQEDDAVVGASQEVVGDRDVVGQGRRGSRVGG